jgi:hypothetical protein
MFLRTNLTILKKGKTGNPNQKVQIQTKTVLRLDCRPKIVKSRKSKQKPKNFGYSNKKSRKSSERLFEGQFTVVALLLNLSTSNF